MVELDRQGFADRQSKWNLAAREQRAAKRNEHDYFMRSFNPNIATRNDFTRFREGLRKQAGELVGATFNPSGSIGIMGSDNAAKFHALYSTPYRKMMNQYMMTNPDSYKSHFPKSYFAQRALPNLMKMGIGAVTGIPGLSKMFGDSDKANEEILGDYSYLKSRPVRFETQPNDMSDELWEIIMDANNQGIKTSPYDEWYDQFFPMDVPDYFHQFMDDEMLPYKLGVR
jgi:hypothetical protein